MYYGDFKPEDHKHILESLRRVSNAKLIRLLAFYGVNSTLRPNVAILYILAIQYELARRMGVAEEMLELLPQKEDIKL